MSRKSIRRCSCTAGLRQIRSPDQRVRVTRRAYRQAEDIEDTEDFEDEEDRGPGCCRHFALIIP